APPGRPRSWSRRGPVASALRWEAPSRLPRRTARERWPPAPLHPRRAWHALIPKIAASLRRTASRARPGQTITGLPWLRYSPVGSKSHGLESWLSLRRDEAMTDALLLVFTLVYVPLDDEKHGQP